MYLHKLVSVHVFLYFIRETNLNTTEDEVLRQYKLFMVLGTFEHVIRQVDLIR